MQSTAVKLVLLIYFLGVTNGQIIVKLNNTHPCTMEDDLKKFIAVCQPKRIEDFAPTGYNTTHVWFVANNGSLECTAKIGDISKIALCTIHINTPINVVVVVPPKCRDIYGHPIHCRDTFNPPIKQKKIIKGFYYKKKN
ncbi:uncharacterized protein [Onthophagus taurus]|uniref:uncharacterized protein n=1 Tax=Onthophagus taurus TaxID=166361 RepID=UPI0039BEBEB6